MVKGDNLYAHVLAYPEANEVLIRSLSEGNPLMEKAINSVSLVGSDQVLQFKRNSEGLLIELPEEEMPTEISLLLKIS